ncbi:YqaA family protein [Lutibaculum baratangense]|uniref:Putative membrane protein n=1 Tax=Lutibaculum baratangense AMV1 TaxID=631454 RepID=V4RVV7_9HYPH|nr:YqaA family protein [Lutibaculum baratangense]ESR27175.1 putative membrane protein [Lutibaculum baratangense AMV1]
MEWVAAYGGLFLSAFLAATLLPGSSEALLTGLALTGRWNTWSLLVAASAGNVLGSVANWLAGRMLSRLKGTRWSPVSERSYDRASRLFERYGIWSLFFAWVPIVGDPLTVVAGALRVPFLPFLVMVAAGKVARYLVVLGGVLWWQGA